MTFYINLLNLKYMEILAKHEPQELRIDDTEESKSSALQVIHDRTCWNSSAFQGTHESEREESGSPAMEDK